MPTNFHYDCRRCDCSIFMMLASGSISQFVETSNDQRFSEFSSADRGSLDRDGLNLHIQGYIYL
jgi:hypothetical protein